MKPITPTDRSRFEMAIATMYGKPYLAPKALIGEVAEEIGCSRRQLERAFKGFEVGPAQELRAIRCELAAACLVHPEWRDKKEQVIAHRVGLLDARALRRLTSTRWDISPSEIREGAWFHRHLRWAETRTLHRHVGWPGGLGEDSYCEGIRRALRGILEGRPIETRRLIEGEVQLPLPSRAAAEMRSLASERVARRWQGVLHEAGLGA